jgi:uncharacterized membrane protein YbaN (DUF454 family)
LDNLPVRSPESPPKPLRSKWRRFLILFSGWMFVVLGVLGIFLPILQGILFLAVGFYLLSLESPWAHRKIEQMREKYPRLGATFDQARLRAARYARKLRKLTR